MDTTLACLIVALGSVAWPCFVPAQTYHTGAVADIHGPRSEEVQNVLKRAETEPEALRDLQALPLEQTFWALKERRSPSTPDYAAMRPIAEEILFQHPDLESYIARHLKRMAELLEPETQPTEYKEQQQRDIAQQYINSYVKSASIVPGDGAFRLLGPRVFDRTWKVDFGDTEARSHSYMANDFLRPLIRKRFPGEPVPANLEEMKEWWKANEQRFAVKVPPAVPVAVAPKPPGVERMPSARPRLAGQSAHREPQSAASPRSENEMIYWMIAAFAALAGGFALLLRKRRRT